MAESNNLQPLFLLDDEPINSHQRDAFKGDPFAKTIAQAALGTKGPFTIGVYGGWGSGKTSVLHAARTMIDDDPMWSHVVTVEFNAWRYEREQHPIVPLVATIERAVSERLKDERAFVSKIGGSAVAGFKRFRQATRSLLSAFSGEVGGKVKFPGLGEMDAKVALDPSKGIETWDKDTEADELAKETAWSKASTSALYKSIFDQMNLLPLGDEGATSSESSKVPRVIVFVDDLDRCQADRAFELLESVKLVLCQPGFVFVLALNHAVVDAYLSHMAETRYGKDNARLHKSYLEKIVQLPLTMPARSESFVGFAKHLLNERLSKSVDPLLRDGLTRLASVLALSANRTPRTLVRRINTALIDIALRDPSTLPLSLRSEVGACPVFSGLCIVQRTLEASIGTAQTRELAMDQELCTLLRDKGIFGALDVLKRKVTGNEPDEGLLVRSVGDSAKMFKEAIRGTVDPNIGDRWRAVVEAIYDEPFLYQDDLDSDDPIRGTSVLTSEGGIRWLSNRAERLAVMQVSRQNPEERSGESELKAPTQESGFRLGPVEITQRRVPAKDYQIIERQVRQYLKLPAHAPIGRAEFARAKELDFHNDQLTDAGAIWMASNESSLDALTTLWLNGTQVTDVGIAALAAGDSCLSALACLYLSDTQVADAGMAAIAATNSSLSRLTHLDLTATKVTDTGVTALSAKGSPLSSLTNLFLQGLRITDSSLAAISAADSGLSGLAALFLAGTQVSDVGLIELARKDSSVSALTNLWLGNTRVSDRAMVALAAERSALSTLTTLFLWGTEVTDKGVVTLAGGRSALSALRTLYVGGSGITDESLDALASDKSGLVALIEVWLQGARVTEAGLLRLRKARPTITIYR